MKSRRQIFFQPLTVTVGLIAFFQYSICGAAFPDEFRYPTEQEPGAAQNLEQKLPMMPDDIRAFAGEVKGVKNVPDDDRTTLIVAPSPKEAAQRLVMTYLQDNQHDVNFRGWLQSGDIKKIETWKQIFQSAKQENLFGAIQPELEQGLKKSAQFGQGNTPEKFMGVIIGAIGTPPMTPLATLSDEAQKKISDFAIGPMSNFSAHAYFQPSTQRISNWFDNPTSAKLTATIGDGLPVVLLLLKTSALAGVSSPLLNLASDRRLIQGAQVLGVSPVLQVTKEMFSQPDELGRAASSLIKAAEETFGNPTLARMFGQLAEVSGHVVLSPQDKMQIIDTVNCINGRLGYFGLHLNVDYSALPTGHVNISTHKVLGHYDFSIENVPMRSYLMESMNGHVTEENAHFLPETGDLVLFTDKIKEVVAVNQGRLKGNISSLMVLQADNSLLPVAPLTHQQVQSIEDSVKSWGEKEWGGPPSDKNLTTVIVRDMNNHEGRHNFNIPFLNNAVNKGIISAETRINVDEMGAWCYQLEKSDPRMAHANLLEIVSNALHTPNAGAVPTQIGTRNLLINLQEHLPVEAQLYDAQKSLWIPEGFVAMFRLSPHIIKEAAEQTRLQFDHDFEIHP